MRAQSKLLPELEPGHCWPGSCLDCWMVVVLRADAFLGGDLIRKGSGRQEGRLKGITLEHFGVCR